MVKHNKLTAVVLRAADYEQLQRNQHRSPEDGLTALQWLLATESKVPGVKNRLMRILLPSAAGDRFLDTSALIYCWRERVIAEKVQQHLFQLSQLEANPELASVV